MSSNRVSEEKYLTISGSYLSHWAKQDHFFLIISWSISEYKIKFPLAPMGVLTHRSEQLDPPLSPPSTPAEIFRCTCRQSRLQTSSPTPQKSYLNFQNPRTTFEEKKSFPPKSCIVQGEEGVPEIVLWLES